MRGGFDWHYVLTLFGNGALWRAVEVVLKLSVLSWVVGVTLGMGVALLRRHRSRTVQAGTSLYIWFFRSVPLLVLIVFVYNIPLVLPSAHGVLSHPFWAGFVAITLTEIAYTAEIHRGGLVSVNADQYDAGKALGLSDRQVFTHVVLPQALRVSIPSLRNDLISIVKLTSLVSVISLPELLYTGQQLYSSTFKVLETLLAVTVFYVAIVTLLDAVLRWLERRLDVYSRPLAPSSGSELPLAVKRRAMQPRKRHPHAGEVAIEVRDVVKRFGTLTVLDGISARVHKGEVVAVIGPSGSGKTTLIRSLNQLETIDEGMIMVAGVDRALVPRKGTGSVDGSVSFTHRRDVGMVFQRFNLFPHKTVMGNLLLAPKLLLEGSKHELEEQALELLRQVGLEEHQHKYPHQLSGGQQQRVAIARALMMRPQVILFDEPTSALDRELVGEVLDTISALAAQGLTMVVISHELRFVEKVADWVVFMDAGRVVEEGVPEAVMRTPTQKRTREFFGHELPEPLTGTETAIPVS